MSAICGLVNWENDPSQRPRLAKMLNALAHHGLDGTNSWTQGGVAFGHQTKRITPESQFEQQPRHDPIAGLTITADVRLDNRDELFRQLGLSQQDGLERSDSHLILTAYKKWGEAFVNYLIGDFSFALWDEPNHKLICCRDHLGNRPLFYHYKQGNFVFASEAKGVLATLSDVQLNKRKIALLAYRATLRQDVENSYFEDVLGLPAATMMIVSKQGVRQHTYWEPTVNNSLGIRRDDDVLEALKALLFEVIQAYLRSAYPVSALLSGGLDSSAIVSVAAHCLAQQEQTLTTLSSVLPKNGQADIPTLRDEREYIDQFQTWSNIQLKYVTAPNKSAFDNVERLVWGYESPAPVVAHYLYTAFVEAAQAVGSRVILDGAGGELGLTYHGEGCYSELFLRGYWPTLWRELKLRGQQNGMSLWRMFRSHVLRPVLPGWAHNLRHAISRQNKPLAHLHILHPDFLVDQLGANHQELRNVQLRTYREHPFHRNNQHPAICRARKPSQVPGFVGYERVQMRNPLRDIRLLEFCLAAPANLKIRNGYNRYLVRGSLDKILPPKIQWRTSKEPFSPDFYLRYNAQRAQVMAFLSDIKPSDPVRHIVDVEKLKRYATYDMTETRPKTVEDFAAGRLVPQGIYLITFLRQFAGF